jgi:enoyl-CoA hydratase
MSEETFGRIRLSIEERVATITLDDPDRRNAFDLGMVKDMVAAYDRIEGGDDVGAVIVTGAPPAFCAGADLSHLGAMAREGLLQVYEGFMRTAQCPLPTIAAVNGAAVGAGMNLALACDVRLTAESAKLDARFLQLGLHPGGGHTWMSRRIVGPQAAAATVLFGEVLDGKEAERLGFSFRCYADDQLLPAAQEMAARAAAGPPELVKRMKQTLKDVADIDEHVAALERELDDQVWSVEQPAFRELLAKIQARISSK